MCKQPKIRSRFPAICLLVLTVFVLSVRPATGRSKGTVDGRVLREIEFAVKIFVEKEQHLPTRWSQLDAVHDFTGANAAWSISAGESRAVQREYAILPKPLKLENGRNIIVVQRLPSEDGEGNLMRRFVWLGNGEVESSTSREDWFSALAGEFVLPEPDPLVVARALEKLKPALAEAEENRRSDRIERIYYLRNRVLSFLYGDEAIFEPDGSIGVTNRAMWATLFLVLLSLAAIFGFMRWRKSKPR